MPLELYPQPLQYFLFGKISNSSPPVQIFTDLIIYPSIISPVILHEELMHEDSARRIHAGLPVYFHNTICTFTLEYLIIFVLMFTSPLGGDF